MILFLDSSSIVSIYVQEGVRSSVIAASMEQADAVGCSVLARVEVPSAFARATRAGRFTDREHAQALASFTTDWPSYVRVPALDNLLERAAQLTWSRALKSLDAIQLASAMLLRDEIPDAVTFSSWDEVLRNAALGENFELAHEML